MQTGVAQPHPGLVYRLIVFLHRGHVDSTGDVNLGVRRAKRIRVMNTTLHSASTLKEEFRNTFRLALPLILAEVGWMSMGIVDTIMVGRLPNSAVAIGATGLGQSLYHSVAIFGGGLLLGMDTF